MCDPTKRTQETYDEVAPVYAAKNSKAYPLLQADLAAFTAGLDRKAVIADIGCGPGRDTTLLRGLGYLVVGVDLSYGQLKAGRLPGVVQADMRRLPFTDGSIDAIWCHAALLHIPRESVPGALAEFARVARTGSPLNLVVAEGDGQGWEPAVAYGSKSPRWFTLHREADLTAQLEAAGFRVEQIQHESSKRDWLAVRGRRVEAGQAGGPP